MKFPQKEAENSDDIIKDVELVVLVQQGNSQAFDELVLRHNKRLFGLIYHMTQDRDDAYDLSQEVFAKAYRSIKRFKQKSTFYTWLYTIAVNTTINHLKKQKRRVTVSLDDEDSSVNHGNTITSQSEESTPRQEMDRKILRKKLNAAIMNLSESHRVVVVLFDIQGMPHAQISKILGISEGTVRSRLYYAHKNLQSQLEEFKKTL